MRILGIDPGNVESGWALVDEFNPDRPDGGVLKNHAMLKMLEGQWRQWTPILAIEMMRARGMPTANEEMETLVWIGRFQQTWYDPEGVRFVYRSDVKSFLCGSMKAKDANVRQALIDLFPATGGGKVKQVGTKKAPGPLFGFSSHAWPALGVALTCKHQLEEHAKRRRARL